MQPTRIFIVTDARGRVRGFPYTYEGMALDALKEADATWPDERPHRVVRYVPDYSPLRHI